MAQNSVQFLTRGFNPCKANLQKLQDVKYLFDELLFEIFICFDVFKEPYGSNVKDDEVMCVYAHQLIRKRFLCIFLSILSCNF